MTDEEITRFYIQYVDMVFRIALVMTRNQADAEDIQQDVFIALTRYSDRIQSERHLKAWLIRVTINACRKHFRKLWLRLILPYDDTLFKDGEEGFGLWAPDPAEAAEDDTEERLDLLRENVEKLPENARMVIHLFYYEQMPVRDIAYSLGITEQNAKTRLSRARDKLRQMMEDQSP